MAFNGAGTFVRLYSWAAEKLAGHAISSTKMDAEMDGFATGLSNCLTRDGQSTPSATIPFNNQRISGLGDATANTDAVNRRTGDGRYLLASGEARKITTAIDDVVNSGITRVAQFGHTTSGTPAIGIGVGIELAAETNAGLTIGGAIDAVTTAVASGAEAYDVIVRTKNGGALGVAGTFKANGGFETAGGITSGGAIAAGGAITAGGNVVVPAANRVTSTGVKLTIGAGGTGNGSTLDIDSPSVSLPNMQSASSGTAVIVTGTGNNLKFTSSSLRFKNDVQPIPVMEARRAVRALQGVTYVSNIATDDQTRRDLGFIAEWLHDANLPMLVCYGTNADGTLRPDSVKYERAAPYLAIALADALNRIDALEARP